MQHITLLCCLKIFIFYCCVYHLYYNIVLLKIVLQILILKTIKLIFFKYILTKKKKMLFKCIHILLKVLDQNNYYTKFSVFINKIHAYIAYTIDAYKIDQVIYVLIHFSNP